MGRLSLNTRRLIARGIGPRDALRWRAGTVFLSAVPGNRATLTTALAGANNDLTLIAKTPGTAGNSITLTIVVAGASTPLSVSVSTNTITVNSATSAGSAATSTAADVRRAINQNAAAYLLVHAQNAPGSDGSGVVTALTSTALSGAT